MYKDGQIITDHKAFANWTNANGNKFSDRPNGDGTYTVYEIVIPEPTEYEKAQARIAELKQMLADSDYVVIKIAEGVSTADDYSEILNSRKAWRAEINELELVVDQTEIKDTVA